jgi:hypothetical protein
MSTRQEQKQRRRQERLAQEQARERATARRRRLQIAGGGAAVLVAIVVAVIVLAGSGGQSRSPTTQGQEPLASVSSAATGQPVDGIQCQATEQVLFHIHAHLAVYVNGQPRVVPAGIGIPPPRTELRTAQGPFVSGGTCFYWLHSHTEDGVIHIESPFQRTYTLGNYFDIWRQPLGPNRVGPATGPVTAYRNGHPFAGNPRSLPLGAHTLIQLDVGTRVAPKPFTFGPGL